MTYEDPTSIENVIASTLLADAYKFTKLQNANIDNYFDLNYGKKLKDTYNSIEHSIRTLSPELRKGAMEIIKNMHDHPEQYVNNQKVSPKYTAETLQTLCYMILSFNESIPMHENDDDLSM